MATGSLGSFSCNRSANSFSRTKEYIVGLSGEQLTELGAGNAWAHTNIYAAGQLLATYSGSDTYFALHDWLGTKRAESGVDGCLTTYGSLPFGDGMDTFNPTADPCPSDATEHHFTGKERDAESGNDYFGARYYSSTMGRFLSPDWAAKLEGSNPVPYANLEYPQTLNLYSYAGNNPLSRTDPDGHFWQELNNWLKWGHWVNNAGLEGALQKEADQDRQELAGLKNMSINGKSPAAAAKGLNNQQTILLERSVFNFLSSQVMGKPSTMVALAIVTDGAGEIDAATATAIAEGRATQWIVQTGKSALATDISTNITAEQFGANLEASGFTKSVAKDGVTTLYSNGDQVYSIYPKACSTGGPTENLNVGGQIVTKIRLQP